MLRKARIQRLAAVANRMSRTTRFRVWWAGELKGFGKVFIYDSTVGPLRVLNLTLANKCLRAGGTHDLETTQQVPSVAGSSCRWSTMRSRISGGKGHDIVVCIKSV